MALLPVAASSQWASEAPQSSDKRTLPTREAWAPKDPRDLANFTAAVSKRYVGKIATWEFLNEPLFANYSLLSPLGMIFWLIPYLLLRSKLDNTKGSYKHLDAINVHLSITFITIVGTAIGFGCDIANYLK